MTPPHAQQLHVKYPKVKLQKEKNLFNFTDLLDKHGINTAKNIYCRFVKFVHKWINLNANNFAKMWTKTMECECPSSVAEKLSHAVEI